MTDNLENKILELYHQGKKNRVIARELSIHHNTVKYWLDKNELKANYFGQPIEMVDEDRARCSKCKLVLHIDNFQFGRKGKDYQYRFSYCNECRKKQCYLNLNNDLNKFLSNTFNRSKLRAVKKGITFTISKQEYINQFNLQNGLCFYTDELLICKVNNKLSRNSLSIDKIDPDKGYVKGNVVFTTHRINTCKNDLSLEEIQKWMPDWYKRIEKFKERKENLLEEVIMERLK